MIRKISTLLLTLTLATTLACGDDDDNKNTNTATNNNTNTANNTSTGVATNTGVSTSTGVATNTGVATSTSTGTATSTGGGGGGDAVAGQMVFNDTGCSGCHGMDLTVAGPVSNMKALATKAGDAAFIRMVLENGVSGTAMASYKDRLSAKELDDVIAYIQTAAQ